MAERKTALFDVDNTIYKGYLIFDLARFQVERKTLPAECLDILVDDTKNYTSENGILYSTYARRAMKHWASGLAGRPYAEIYDQTLEFLQTEGNNFFPYFPRVADLIRSTHDLHLVTAEPQFVSEVIESLFNLQKSASSIFEVSNGKLTGKADVLATQKQKIKAVKKALGRGYNLNDSFGFGDSDSDIGILDLASFPIGIEKERRDYNFEKHCFDKGWSVVSPYSAEELVINILS